MSVSLSQMEAKVQAFIEQDEKDKAVKLLFEMVKACAKAKQFKKADQFRKQISEVNSLALTQIIGAAEIIDAEKAKAIDSDHKMVWADLYDQMNEVEASDFYFALKKMELPPEKMILQQGRVNNRLFLVDSGIMKILYEKDKKEMFLKESGKGEPVGYQSFFSISYATITAVSRGPVTLHMLDRNTWDQLMIDHPGIGGKLETTCKNRIKNRVEDILKKKSAERRMHERFHINGKAGVQILDAQGQPQQPVFSVVMEDLSRGGVAFSFRKSSSKEARMFLGRHALLDIRAGKGRLSKSGRIIGVYNQMFNEFLVNFKFDELELSEKISRMVAASKAGE